MSRERKPMRTATEVFDSLRDLLDKMGVPFFDQGARRFESHHGMGGYSIPSLLRLQWHGNDLTSLTFFWGPEQSPYGMVRLSFDGSWHLERAPQMWAHDPSTGRRWWCVEALAQLAKVDYLPPERSCSLEEELVESAVRVFAQLWHQHHTEADRLLGRPTDS